MFYNCTKTCVKFYTGWLSRNAQTSSRELNILEGNLLEYDADDFDETDGDGEGTKVVDFHLEVKCL